MSAQQSMSSPASGTALPSVEGFSDAVVVKHMIRAIEGAATVEEPFAYRYVENVFPEGFYDAVDAVFPDPSRGMKIVADRRAHRDGYSDRRMTVDMGAMAPNELEGLPPALRQIKRVTTHPRLAQYLLKTFSQALKPYVGILRAQADEERRNGSVVVDRGCELIYDATGFELRPHTDGNQKLVTFLIYFPTPGAPESLGTHVYGVRPGATVSEKVKSGRLFMSWEDAADFGAVPYRRNSMLVFPRTAFSLHGVPPVDGADPRRLVQCSLIFSGLLGEEGA